MMLEGEVEVEVSQPHVSLESGEGGPSQCSLTFTVDTRGSPAVIRVLTKYQASRYLTP